ncbi:hypothetical protein EDB87DRAFT_670856 [Lactarius vividus]|nr:hypothetical protein EDB87DRAFT_670856 [Lactarius vividus]
MRPVLHTWRVHQGANSEPSPPPQLVGCTRGCSHHPHSQARQYTPSPLALAQATVSQGQGQGPNSGPGSLSPAASFPPSPSRTGSSPISPTTLRHTLKPVKSEPAFRASQSKSPAPDRDGEAPASPTTLMGITAPSIQISTQESRASLETDNSPGARYGLKLRWMSRARIWGTPALSRCNCPHPHQPHPCPRRPLARRLPETPRSGRKSPSLRSGPNRYASRTTACAKARPCR